MAKWTVDNYDGTNPKFILNSAGKWGVQETDECCCEEVGDSCFYCDHTIAPTPAKVTATFSDVAICACSQDHDINAYSQHALTPSINSAHTLSQLAGPCEWGKTYAGGLTKSWFNSGCSVGGATGSSAVDWTIFYQYAGNVLNVKAYYQHPDEGQITFFEGSYLSGYTTEFLNPGQSDCSDTFGPHPNETGCGASCVGCLLSALGTVGYTGTVTVAMG